MGATRTRSLEQTVRLSVWAAPIQIGLGRHTDAILDLYFLHDLVIQKFNFTKLSQFVSVDDKRLSLITF